MFTIIGSDLKQYGPVSAEEVLQWIREGRADGRTLARAEGSTEWKPLAAFPEFASQTAAAGVPPMPLGVSPRSVPPAKDEIIARDYELDIERCLSRSWALLKENFWPVVGYTFLASLAMGLVNQAINLISRSQSQAIVDNWMQNHKFTTDGLWVIVLTWVLMMPVQTLFVGGMYRYYLMLMRGEEPTLEDMFSGFTRAPLQLVLLGVVMGILVMVAMLFFILPGIYVSIAWFFSIPLVVDRQMPFMEAMALSMRMVNKHWFMVFALAIVAGLVSFAGIFGCCIGIFVTIPFAHATVMYAYEDIFGRR